MKLTLRKSDAVQKSIQEALSETQLETTAKIDRFVNAPQVVKDAQHRLQADLAKRRSLLVAYYSLREATAAEQNAAGVPDLLAELALADKMIGMVKPLAAIKQFAPSDENLTEQQMDLKNEKTERYSRRESFDVPLLTESDKRVFVAELAELHRKKQNISDDLLDRNVKHTIEVEDKVESVLRQYHII
jgi:hypothetical protein